MSLIKTKDNFIWLDVTDKCITQDAIDNLLIVHTLFVVYDDGTESMLYTHQEVTNMINEGHIIGVEVGHLPPREWWYKYAEKKLIRGYWYVKIDDIKFV